MEASPVVSFIVSESVITLERAVDGNAAAAMIAAAPPINTSRLVKSAMCPLLPMTTTTWKNLLND
jgi:hypothetical protein